jgi:hypothetical protein
MFFEVLAGFKERLLRESGSAFPDPTKSHVLNQLVPGLTRGVYWRADVIVLTVLFQKKESSKEMQIRAST